MLHTGRGANGEEGGGGRLHPAFACLGECHWNQIGRMHQPQMLSMVCNMWDCAKSELSLAICTTTILSKDDRSCAHVRERVTSKLSGCYSV